MKKIFAAVTASSIATASLAGDFSSPSTTEVYDPTFFAGFTWSFGGPAGSADSSIPFGFGIKILSTNKPDVLAAAAGITYYFDGTFGCDIGAAINNGGGSLSLTYDFCRNTPQIGLGAIKKPETTTTTLPLSATVSTD